MNPHDSHCEHDLKFCVPCDVAYCEKCKKEWGAPCMRNHFPLVSSPLPSPINPSFLPTVPYAGGAGLPYPEHITVWATDGQHVHGGYP